MASKNSLKKRKSRVLDAIKREREQIEKKQSKQMRSTNNSTNNRSTGTLSIGQTIRREKNNNSDDGNNNNNNNNNVRSLKVSNKTIMKKTRERKNMNKIVKGVRIGNIVKLKKNVSYNGIMIKDAESKQAVLDMIKAEDRMNT
jgi:hypothetical protein